MKLYNKITFAEVVDCRSKTDVCICFDQVDRKNRKRIGFIRNNNLYLNNGNIIVFVHVTKNYINSFDAILHETRFRNAFFWDFICYTRKKNLPEKSFKLHIPQYNYPLIFKLTNTTILVDVWENLYSLELDDFVKYYRKKIRYSDHNDFHLELMRRNHANI